MHSYICLARYLATYSAELGGMIDRSSRFWLGYEMLFLRRCPAQQFNAAIDGPYRAMWYSGRRDSIFTQQVKLLIAHCRTVFATRLSARQRYSCLHAIANRAISRGHHWRRLTGALVGNS